MIKSITVVTSTEVADTLILTFDIPSGTYPFDSDATAMMKVASQKGEEYAKKHFPDIPIHVIECY